MAEQIRLRVRGMTPIPWGSNEWAWRQHLAHEGKSKRSGIESSPVSAATRFAVEVIFYMSASRVGRADLDNLAKPVLDTLFRPRYAQVSNLDLTGALFDLDDDRVFMLILEKRLVATEEEQGADVTVSWE
jgi:Holliday junction resolvase RusA-like endonuclease